MKKAVSVLGILVAIAMIIVGITMKIPEKRVYVSSSSYAYDYDWSKNTGAEYLGGDCYNYIVEASLKAGYANGIMTAKAITIVGGILLLFMMLMSIANAEGGTRSTIADSPAMPIGQGSQAEQIAENKPQDAAPVKQKSHTWKCAKCGTENEQTVPYCKNCGEYR